MLQSHLIHEGLKMSLDWKSFLLNILQHLIRKIVDICSTIQSGLDISISHGDKSSVASLWISIGSGVRLSIVVLFTTEVFSSSDVCPARFVLSSRFSSANKISFNLISCNEMEKEWPWQWKSYNYAVIIIFSYLNRYSWQPEPVGGTHFHMNGLTRRLVFNTSFTTDCVVYFYALKINLEWSDKMTLSPSPSFCHVKLKRKPDQN